MALYPDDLPWLSKPVRSRPSGARSRRLRCASSASPGTWTPRPERAGSHRAAPWASTRWRSASRPPASTASRMASSSPSSGWPSPGGRCRPDRSCSSAPTSSGRCAPRSGCGRSASAGISSPSSSRIPSGSRASHRSADSSSRSRIRPGDGCRRYGSRGGRRRCGARRTKRGSSGCSPSSAASGSTLSSSGTRPPRRYSRSSRPGRKPGLRADGGMAVRRVAIGAVVAAVVLAVVLALGWFRGGAGPAPTQPLSATAALATPALSFGDPLAARVEVLADAKEVDVGSLRVRPRFAPWRIVSETRERHSGAGTLLVYRWTLECLSQARLPGRTLAERRFLPALISYRRRPGGRRRVVEWPTCRVVTRLTTPDIGDPTSTLPPTLRPRPSPAGSRRTRSRPSSPRSRRCSWSQRGCSSGSRCRGGNEREVLNCRRSRARSSSSGRARRTATQHSGARRSGGWRAS